MLGLQPKGKLVPLLKHLHTHTHEKLTAASHHLINLRTVQYPQPRWLIVEMDCVQRQKPLPTTRSKEV